MKRLIAAVLTFVVVAGIATLAIEVRQCRQAVAAADEAFDVVVRAFEASAASHQASADEDIVALLDATLTMQDLTPEIETTTDAYVEAREKC